MVFVRSVLSLLLLTAVHADKDTSYYNANHGNPNVDLKMYWKDAENILDDLSEFQSLHVEFHSCVWSFIHDSQNANYYTMENEQSESLDGNDYWYMGSVPPMGANVAFSLYGSLKGERFRGCNKNTFINSFYTNTGFTDFTTALSYAGITFSSSSYSTTCYNGKSVACDSTNGFAVHTYSTNECNPYYFSGVADTMTDLNSGMSKVTCTEIYNAKKNKYYYSDDDGTSPYYGSALQLLEYSSACNYMDYMSLDGNCPDPYGIVNKYVENYSAGIKQKHDDPYKDYNQGMKLAKQYTLSGAVLFLTACVVVVFFGTMTKPKNLVRVKAAHKQIKGRLREKRDRLKQKMKKTAPTQDNFADPDEFMDEPETANL